MSIVPDYRDFAAQTNQVDGAAISPRQSHAFWTSKRIFDLVFSAIVLVPVTLMISVVLLVLNPIYNPGPLFYLQKRMGRDCRPFKALKFRTMTEIPRQKRGPNDPLEHDRITALGRILRNSRIDELPQIVNVFRGDMSLIGPRPDCFRHALHFAKAIPDYRKRHMVRPGISGLAQIDLGYIEGTDATRLKTAADIAYIQNAGFRLDILILWRTIATVIGMRGS